MMTLFSDPADYNSHRVRVVTKEKDIVIDIKEVDPDHLPEDVLLASPDGTLPALIERDLKLYDPLVMIEFLDERYPFPPLMPVDPQIRATARQTLNYIRREWEPSIQLVLSGEDKKGVEKARKFLKEEFIKLTPAFQHKPYFMSDEYTVVDVTLSVIFWRLTAMGIDIPKTHKAFHEYAKRMFMRDSFRDSLTDLELEMGDI
jgi:RNA polymerase-associated protein